MVDATALAFEVYVYVLWWITFGSDFPSFGEIMCYAIVVELVQMYWLLEFPTGEILNEGDSNEFQENPVDDDVPVASSSAFLELYQSLDLKQRLSPERTVAILDPLKQTKGFMVPTVHSEAVCSFCQAIDLRAKLAPVENRVVLNPPKVSIKDTVTPVVHSEMVYKNCLALNLKANLARQKEGRKAKGR
ncbi:hypothetical protein NPIL_300291 [Nephila pilipes]|uniref:Uncharacterized protein n=1 Tax=Nephila pilipes TaxID=299642 RepID=A0A8X6R202_NEPPI|nr:hypothetical protein NPIL_300291 [Nephila pilipes]